MASPKPLSIVQFSDTHLFAMNAERLCGLDTADSLARVLDLARSDGWAPDAVLATGDLSQDESAGSYQRFVDAFTNQGSPVYCLPGNHDAPRVMSAVFNASADVHLARWADLGTWQLVLLNSQVPNDNAGELADEELDFLDRTLRNNPHRHALVTLHHNPIPMGSAWLDTMSLRNADRFFEVIDRHPHVRAVVWGHVHQEHESTRGAVKLLSAPSTSLQFLPKSKDFALDVRPPGYRRIELHADGRVESRVRRLPSYAFTPDLTSRGY